MVAASHSSGYSAGLALHIVLAILATSIITIGAVHAMFMAYENQQLKHGHHFRLIRHMPPLQTMEQHWPVFLVQERLSNNNVVVALDAQETRIECGVVKLAERETIGDSRLTLLTIREDVSGIQ